MINSSQTSQLLFLTRFPFSLLANAHYFLLAACIICAILANLSGYLWADVDLFTRAAVGKIFMLTGDAPYKDLFAYTPTKDIWHDHEVIPGILTYLLTLTGTDISIYIARVVFAALTLVLILLTQRASIQKQQLHYALLLFFFTAWVCQIFWYSILRAHSFSALFFAAFLLFFVSYRNTKKIRWLIPLPLIMTIWVNSHGGFTLGLLTVGGFFGGFFLERFIKPLRPDNSTTVSITAPCLALICSILATTLNFYGLSFLTFIADALLHPPSFIRVDPPAIITEWAPLPWSSFEGMMLLLSLVLIAVGLKISRRRLPTEAWLLLALTLYAGVSHVRFVPFTFITLVAYYSAPFCDGLDLIASKLDSFKQILQKALKLLAAPLTLWFLILTLAPLYNWRGFSLNYDKYPVSALNWLTATQAPGRLMTSYDSGSFALWRVYPRFKISLDGRFDGAFPVETLQMVFGAYTTKNARHLEYFERLDPDYVLIEANSAEEKEAPSLFPNRFELYNDNKWIILGRSAPDVIATDAPDEAIKSIWYSEWDTYPQ